MLYVLLTLAGAISLFLIVMPVILLDYYSWPAMILQLATGFFSFLAICHLSVSL